MPYFRAVMILGLMCVASSALANNYGAIAYDRQSGAWGYAYDQSSPQAAQRRALAECGRHSARCSVVVQFVNACAAYATGAGTTAGWGIAAVRPAAEQQALAACNSRGGHCQIRV